MMVGAFLKGAEYKMTLLVDGFNVSAALLVAQQMNPHLLDYCIFAHQSDEKGHGAVLKHLGVKPLLKLGMRLGEGTGAAVAYPLLLSAVNFLNEMASFEDARVSRNL
jgi:nicotinate-nucleotide--dimethylbenzimidazole phosphoribosyltransferase